MSLDETKRQTTLQFVQLFIFLLRLLDDQVQTRFRTEHKLLNESTCQEHIGHQRHHLNLFNPA